jgi:hypothetical protein
LFSIPSSWANGWLGIVKTSLGPRDDHSLWRPAMNATATAPHNVEAEISVLGACLQDAEAARVAVETLPASAFFRDAHCEIFGAINSLVARGVTADLRSVYQVLLERGTVERAGGVLSSKCSCMRCRQW